jgi:hypothetical protein
MIEDILQNRERLWNYDVNENFKVAYIFVWRQKVEIELHVFADLSEKKAPVYIWDMDNCCNTMEISLYF